MWPSPGRLNCAQGGCGHEKRVDLSWTGVVSVIAVLLGAGLDQKILIRRQFFHVTILQDYLTSANAGYVTQAQHDHAGVTLMPINRCSPERRKKPERYVMLLGSVHEPRSRVHLSLQAQEGMA
jgi:hypothetical protein